MTKPGTQPRTWEENYEKLKEYKRNHGDCNVPGFYPPDTALASWVAHHRRKKTKIYPYQREKLNAIGFVFNPKPSPQEKFEIFYPRLAEYKRQHGDCNVSANYKGDPELGKWLRNIKTRHRKGTLTENERERLEELGVVWKLKDIPIVVSVKNETTWQENFEKLKAYKEKFGHTTIKRWDPIHYQLHNWLESQKKNCITAKRREKLAALGVICEEPQDGDRTIAEAAPKNITKDPKDNKYERLWDEKFEELKEYKRLHGTAHISSKSKRHSGLAAWAMKQRAFKRAGNLAPDRQAKLDSLGFAWNFDKNRHGEQKNWYTEFEKLAEFHKMTGHSSPPAEGEMAEIAAWAKEQTELAPYLSDKQRKMLAGIGFQWNTYTEDDADKKIPAKKQPDSKKRARGDSTSKEEQWEEMYEALMVYAGRTGSAAVPSRLKGNMKLANWCKRQRTNYAKGVLSPERQDKLNSIGFSWTLEEGRESTPGDNGAREMQNDAKWNEMLEELKGYQAANGTTNVPMKGDLTALATWVSKQKLCRRQGTLQADREAALDAIGFTWNGRLSQRDKWDAMFRRLAQFHSEHGHTFVPTYGDTEMMALSQWVKEQRENMQTLPPECKGLLNQLGFTWIISNDWWNNMYMRLVDFQRHHLHCCPMAHNPDYPFDPELASWVAYNHDMFKNNMLPYETIRSLDALGFFPPAELQQKLTRTATASGQGQAQMHQL